MKARIRSLRAGWPRSLGSLRTPAARVALLLVIACLHVSVAFGKPAKVRHHPPQPKSGQPVLISVVFKEQSYPADIVLQYQIVEPGKYIALNDPEFKTKWTTIPLHLSSRQQPDDSEYIFSAQIPAEIQSHRRLIRYRIWTPAQKKIVAPDPKDAQPNFAYFVYDGLPPWRGAINPGSPDPALRQPVTFPSTVLQRVPVYHFISRKSSVENVTWNERSNFGDDNARHEYKYTGTMVYDGIVYDHIKFRARGGVWRHSMGKNMWKFNFLPGHRFQARDFYGNDYGAKWDKLNLGACIQQGDYGMRGEQGMFEAVGFRLFNLAGVEAPRAHWVHLRIIDQAEESPRDQYAGDFWGLYLATENVDGHFLDEHKLPPGNVYKIDSFQPKTEFNGDRAITNKSDVLGFLSATMRRQQPIGWWLANVDLPRYYSYRSIIECIHHYDLDAGKNYFYYRNPETRQWAVIPWDIDLTWGDHMFGGGGEPFYRPVLLSHAALREQYQARLAEIRDLLFNPEQLNLLIDEHAAMISDPKGGFSLADADRAKWDFHPVLGSLRADRSKAGQGRFYFGDPRNRFPTMVQYMKTWAAKRMHWIDQFLLYDYRPPSAPRLLAAGAPYRFQISPDNAPPAAVRWRLAEITNPQSPAFDPKRPWKYEINALWEKESKPGQAVEIPASLLERGHLYRLRARSLDPTGRWSRWSAPVQLTGAQ